MRKNTKETPPELRELVGLVAKKPLDRNQTALIVGVPIRTIYRWLAGATPNVASLKLISAACEKIKEALMAESVPPVAPLPPVPQIRGLTPGEVRDKLEELEDMEDLDLLEAYKALEKEVGIRVDPENYKPHRLRYCFLLLWAKKLQGKEAAAERTLEPLTEEEIDRVYSTLPGGSPRISGPPVRIFQPPVMGGFK